MVGRKTDGLGDGRHGARAPAAQDLERHYGSAESDPGHPAVVVGRLGNGPGHMGAVAMIVVGLVIVGHEVEARHEARAL